MILIIILLAAALIYFILRRNKSKSKTDTEDGIKKDSTLSKFFDRLVSKNVDATVKRLKMEKIEVPKQNAKTRYINLIDSILGDLELNMTVEWFTTLVSIACTVIGIIFGMYSGNIVLAGMVGISTAVGAVALFVTRARHHTSTKMLKVMDALDLICPYAYKGILVAMEENLENIDSEVKDYFKNCIIRIKEQNFSIKSAFTLLQKELGPISQSFIEKAIVFETSERKGMAEIFRDVVDENASIREVNNRKEKSSNSKNKEFYMKVAMIVGFIAYSATFKSYREFLFGTNGGKFLLALTICAICIVFARRQYLQMDIGVRRSK